jgi:hypothetical protein
MNAMDVTGEIVEVCLGCVASMDAAQQMHNGCMMNA